MRLIATCCRPDHEPAGWIEGAAAARPPQRRRDASGARDLTSRPPFGSPHSCARPGRGHRPTGSQRAYAILDIPRPGARVGQPLERRQHQRGPRLPCPLTIGPTERRNPGKTRVSSRDGRDSNALEEGAVSSSFNELDEVGHEEPPHETVEETSLAGAGLAHAEVLSEQLPLLRAAAVRLRHVPELAEAVRWAIDELMPIDRAERRRSERLREPPCALPRSAAAW